MGYKKHKQGFGLGAHYFTGKENWLGLNFSILSGYQPKYKIVGPCENENKVIYDKNILQSGNFLNIGYSHSFTSSTNDFSLSLIEMNAPLVIIPTKFGLQYGPNTSGSHFYYRPGIGFRIWHFQFSYNYNLMFSKASRTYSEKNLFGISFKYTIDKTR